MTVLTEITQENADEKVAEVMDGFQQAVGAVPKPLQLMATSPGLFMNQAAVIGYYRNHPTLDGTLLACIRFLSADVLDYPACREFNYQLLQKMGMSAAELEVMKKDLSQAPLEPREIALLEFVVAGVAGRKATDKSSVEGLVEFGWTEADIFDATNQGFSMLAHRRLIEYFQVF